MKKTIILLGFILLSLGIFSQNAKSAIKGAGDFKFGITKAEVKKAVQKYKVGNTNEIDAGDNLIIQNLKYDGELYDECMIAFNKNKLIMVSFTKYTTIDEADAIMERVQAGLEKKYGTPKTEHDLAMWTDKNNKHVILKIETQGRLKVWLVYTGGF